MAFEFKEQSLFKAPSSKWLNLIEKNYNEIVGNCLVKEHEAMMSTFGDQGKLRLNRIMNAIVFGYPDYSKSVPSTVVGGNEKRSMKTSTQKASKKEK